jgi:hypothetical protein
VASENLLGQRHGAIFGLDRGRRLFCRRATLKGNNPRIDYLACDLIFAGSELTERNFFSGLCRSAKVGGGEKAQVLAILL